MVRIRLLSIISPSADWRFEQVQVDTLRYVSMGGASTGLGCRIVLARSSWSFSLDKTCYFPRQSVSRL